MYKPVGLGQLNDLSDTMSEADTMLTSSLTYSTTLPEISYESSCYSSCWDSSDIYVPHNE